MKWLADHSGPDTYSLFHYSGHVCIQSTGPCGGGHTWLWSVDNRFISDDEFGQAMQGIRGWGWVDVAGCEADAFDRGISSQKRLFTGSSAANEKSYEYEPWHESVWTGLVVDQGMLQGRADSDGDGRVSVQEAVRYGQQQAPGMTSDASQRPQHPQISGGSGTWYLEAGNP